MDRRADTAPGGKDLVKKKALSQQGRERLAVLSLSLLFFVTAAAAAAACAVRPPENTPDDAQTLLPAVVPDENAAEPAEDGIPVIPGRQRREFCYTILLSGLDDDNGGSDTNILMRFDAVNKTIDLVSLPRDTLLHHTWRSNKLNYAYAAGGTELLRTEISNLLGVPVDRCVTVDLRGFIRLIDRIGGVDFDVPADMDYDDPAQDLHIHFAKGLRHLSGQEAMEVVRWRKNNDGSGYAAADIGRIGTQQAFLKAAAGQLLRVKNVPALAEMVIACVRTDLTLGNLIWFGNEGINIGLEGLRFHTLPGDGAARYRGESVYALFPEETLALINEALNPYDQPITMEETDILVP